MAKKKLARKAVAKVVVSSRTGKPKPTKKKLTKVERAKTYKPGRTAGKRKGPYARKETKERPAKSITRGLEQAVDMVNETPGSITGTVEGDVDNFRDLVGPNYRTDQPTRDLDPANDPQSGECFNCKAPCTGDTYCFGCRCFVCERCDKSGGMIGAHTRDEHLVDTLDA